MTRHRGPNSLGIFLHKLRATNFQSSSGVWSIMTVKRDLLMLFPSKPRLLIVAFSMVIALKIAILLYVDLLVTYDCEHDLLL
jgi:hypothetical protein